MTSRVYSLVALLSVCIALACCIPRAYGSRRPAPVLQPKTYASPSGRFKLEVDPTEKYGAGPGNYRLTCDGQVVWSGQRPFTLQDAAVSDKGEVVGYSYSAGPEGHAPNRQGPGDFRAVIIDPAGKIRLDVSEPRKFSLILDAPPYPMGVGVILDPENDRFILRLNERFGFDQVCGRRHNRQGRRSVRRQQAGPGLRP